MQHPLTKHLTIKNSSFPWDSLLAVGVLFYLAFRQKQLVLSNPVDPLATEMTAKEAEDYNQQLDRYLDNIKTVTLLTDDEDTDFETIDLDRIKIHLNSAKTAIDELKYDFAVSGNRWKLDENSIAARKGLAKLEDTFDLLTNLDRTEELYQNVIKKFDDSSDEGEVMMNYLLGQIENYKDVLHRYKSSVQFGIQDQFGDENGYVRIKKNPLNINDNMKYWVKDAADALITMNPKDFLYLTTGNDQEYDMIMENARSLDFYNSPEINKDMNVHPFLWVDENGVIIGHEGRHRAAATINNGEKTYEVAIQLHKPHLGLPNRLIAQAKKNDYFIAMPKPKWINKNTVR